MIHVVGRARQSHSHFTPRGVASRRFDDERQSASQFHRSAETEKLLRELSLTSARARVRNILTRAADHKATANNELLAHAAEWRNKTIQLQHAIHMLQERVVRLHHEQIQDESMLSTITYALK